MIKKAVLLIIVLPLLCTGCAEFSNKPTLSYDESSHFDTDCGELPYPGLFAADTPTEFIEWVKTNTASSNKEKAFLDLVHNERLILLPIAAKSSCKIIFVQGSTKDLNYAEYFSYYITMETPQGVLCFTIFKSIDQQKSDDPLEMLLRVRPELQPIQNNIKEKNNEKTGHYYQVDKRISLASYPTIWFFKDNFLVEVVHRTNQQWSDENFDYFDLELVDITPYEFNSSASMLPSSAVE